MADKKISQLTGATTPLAGTEVLPIVQGGSTVKVSIDNVTKGRTVNATTFDTDVAAAGVTLSGTTLSADGTDANISITVTPKGTGSLSTTKLSASGDVSFDGGAFVFNDSGADKDFRVEGDTSANLIFSDASADRVGINTSSPDGRLDVAQGMTNGSTAAFTTPHLALTATDSVNTTGFVGMTMATSDSTEYGYSYGALRDSGGVGDLIWKWHYGSAAGTETLRLTYNGDLNVKTGNLVVGTAAKGIDFSANTHAAGMTSELLNWYEEGTWTPVLSDGTNNATSTVNTSGHYVRVGRTVTVWCRVQINSLGSVSGAVRVTGLPFTARNVESNYGGISFGLAAGMAISANQVPSGIFIPNDTYVALYLWDATTGSTTLQATELTANADLYFSGSYQAA